MGNEEIVYGDKVICVRNQPREALGWERTPQRGRLSRQR
jgi:hypothetical protein